jgi:hypothetical protein
MSLCSGMMAPLCFQDSVPIPIPNYCSTSSQITSDQTRTADGVRRLRRRSARPAQVDRRRGARARARAPPPLSTCCRRGARPDVLGRPVQRRRLTPSSSCVLNHQLLLRRWREHSSVALRLGKPSLHMTLSAYRIYIFWFSLYYTMMVVSVRLPR